MSLSNALSTFKISGPINFGTLNGSTMIGNNMGSYVGKSYIPRTGAASWTTARQQATWTVPYGITSIEFLVIGGGGNTTGWEGGGPGAGGGGYVYGRIDVSPGQAFYIYVAGSGGQSVLRLNNSSGPAAYGNGGSNGGVRGGGGGGGSWGSDPGFPNKSTLSGGYGGVGGPDCDNMSYNAWGGGGHGGGGGGGGGCVYGMCFSGGGGGGAVYSWSWDQRWNWGDTHTRGGGNGGGPGYCKNVNGSGGADGLGGGAGGGNTTLYGGSGGVYIWYPYYGAK